MDVTIENPRGRVPVSLILDDSCPVVNLTHHWIRDCWDIAPNHQGTQPRIPWHNLPAEIPADFARKFADWAGENGVRGKFSVIPMPAGLGRIDQGLPGVPAAKLADWMEVIRTRLAPSFDLTPEMITHTFVVDVTRWQLLPDLEQYEWTAGKSVEQLTEYIAAALQVLRNAGIVAEGVTSPGGFGYGAVEEYAQATLAASRAVNGLRTPFYFKEVTVGTPVPPEVKYPNRERGEAVVSIIACTGDWFGGWTGWDLGNPDQCLTEDLQGGRLREVIDAGVPAVICSHWPGYYFNGTEDGFRVCQTVVERLNRLENIVWMKTSEIADYWAARALAQVSATQGGATVTTPVPWPACTLRFPACRASGIRQDQEPLRRTPGLRSLVPGTWTLEGGDTWVCLDLPEGTTHLTVS